MKRRMRIAANSNVEANEERSLSLPFQRNHARTPFRTIQQSSGENSEVSGNNDSKALSATSETNTLSAQKKITTSTDSSRPKLLVGMNSHAHFRVRSVSPPVILAREKASATTTVCTKTGSSTLSHVTFAPNPTTYTIPNRYEEHGERECEEVVEDFKKQQDSLTTRDAVNEDSATTSSTNQLSTSSKESQPIVDQKQDYKVDNGCLVSKYQKPLLPTKEAVFGHPVLKEKIIPTCQQVSKLLTMFKESKTNKLTRENPTQKLMKKYSASVVQRAAGGGWRGHVDDTTPLSSMCFSLSAHITSIAIHPDGWCVVCGMKDGSVRLFNLLPSGNTNPQHRYGHELTKFDTVDNTCLVMHVEISNDGNFLFAGLRHRSTKVMGWDMVQLKKILQTETNDIDVVKPFEKYLYNENLINSTLGGNKMSDIDSSESGLDSATSCCVLEHQHGSLRGLGSVATVSTNHHYRLLTGLGSLSLHLWNVVIFNDSKGNGSSSGSSGSSDGTLSADWSCIFTKQVSGGLNFSSMQLLHAGTFALTKTQGKEKGLQLWDLSDQAVLNPKGNGKLNLELKLTQGVSSTCGIHQLERQRLKANDSTSPDPSGDANNEEMNVRSTAAADGTNNDGPFIGTLVFGEDMGHDDCFLQSVKIPLQVESNSTKAEGLEMGEKDEENKTFFSSHHSNFTSDGTLRHSGVSSLASKRASIVFDCNDSTQNKSSANRNRLKLAVTSSCLDEHHLLVNRSDGSIFYCDVSSFTATTPSSAESDVLLRPMLLAKLPEGVSSRAAVLSIPCSSISRPANCQTSSDLEANSEVGSDSLLETKAMAGQAESIAVIAVHFNGCDGSDVDSQDEGRFLDTDFNEDNGNSNVSMYAPHGGKCVGVLKVQKLPTSTSVSSSLQENESSIKNDEKDQICSFDAFSCDIKSLFDSGSCLGNKVDDNLASTAPSVGCWVCGDAKTKHWEFPLSQSASILSSTLNATTSTLSTDVSTNFDNNNGNTNKVNEPSTKKKKKDKGSSEVDQVPKSDSLAAKPQKANKAISSNSSKRQLPDDIASLQSHIDTLQAELTEAREQKKQRFAVELELRRQWNAKDCENKKQLEEITMEKTSVEQQLATVQEIVEGGSSSMDVEQLTQIQLTLQQGINRNLELHRSLKETRNEPKGSGHKCVLCLAAPAEVALVPCGHMCFCRNDAAQFRDREARNGGKATCPLCNAVVEKLLPIFPP